MCLLPTLMEKTLGGGRGVGFALGGLPGAISPQRGLALSSPFGGLLGAITGDPMVMYDPLRHLPEEVEIPLRVALQLGARFI